ncbi:Molybdenum-binding protein [Mycobacteroides abscessus]|nr:Molybdenum-binding protein [Mycobacteroides abscessus]
MRLSTRNQLTGTITEVTVGTVMAVVKIRLDGGEQVVTSSITKDAVADLGLTVGQAATGSSSPLR